MRLWPLARVLAVLAALAAGPAALPAPALPSNEKLQGRFALRSPAFAPGGTIPRVYTCDGGDRIVPLRWTAPPRGTRSFALLVDDPDAPSGSFVHRLAWGIPAAARSLPGRAPREGTNGAGRLGWTGPCPPSGVHRYVFTLYALRAPLPLAAGADRAAFARALRGRVLATARLVGRYGR